MGYAQIDERFWVDTADWPLQARIVYLWSIANTHGLRMGGIGEVPDVVVSAEAGLSQAALRRAWEWLQANRRMMRVGHWYFNLDCIRYNCWWTDKKTGTLRVERNHTLSVVNFVQANNVPLAIVRAMIAEYPDLFEADLVSQIGVASSIGPRPRSRNNEERGVGKGVGEGLPQGLGEGLGQGVGVSGYPGTRPSDQPS